MDPCRSPFKLVLALLLLAASATLASADTLLKIATLAPDGTSWMKLSRGWQEAVEKRTEGRVKIKFYTGGSMGDERDMLRKVKLGQISGAGITGIGISAISPEIRAFELARTYEELDEMRAALGDEIKKVLEAKGWVLGAWADIGPIHVFSQKPIKSLDEMRTVKFWIFADDPLMKQLANELKLGGVPLGVPEVLPGLSTGQVDTFFGSPLSVLALQWGSHARYMASNVIAEGDGATVIAKKVWDTISPADQKIIMEEAAKMEAALKTQVRADNDKALATLKSKGLQVYDVPPEMVKTIETVGEKVGRAQMGTGLVSKSFEEKVWKYFEQFKQRRAAGGKS